MARFFQYQNRTQAPLGADPSTQEGRWHQPWSEPPVKSRISPTLAIALMASGLFAPITPQFFAGTGTAIASNIPVGVPYTTTLQYQGKTEPVPFPAQTSSWIYPWSEPVRVRALGAHLQDVGTPDVPLPQPAATTSIGWFFQLAEPVRSKLGLASYLQDSNAPDVALPPPVLSSQWFIPWSEPTRRTGLATNLQDVGAPDVPNPPPVLSAQWYEPWSEPTRLKITAQLQQSSAWGNFTPAAATNDTRWIYPWSEPTRRIGLQTALQDVGTPDVPNPPPVLSSQWFSPWTDPVRFRTFGTYLQDTNAPDVPNPPPVLSSQWFEPWTDPTRLKVTVQFQQSLAWGNFTPTAVVFTDTRWIYPWSEPVRLKPGLGAHLQPTIDNPPPFPIIPNPGTGVVTPVMASAGVQYQAQFQYQALAAPVTTPAPAVVPSYGWFQPLSFIPPPKVTVSEATFIFMNVDNALTNFWYAPWPDFVYPKKSILTAQQQTLAWSNFTPAVVASTDIRWLYQWSEPVRTKLGLPAYEQQSFTWINFTPTVNYDKWAFQWSEPVRVKPGLGVYNQQTLAWSNFTPAVVVFSPSWYEPWSEPVRLKKGLPASEQQAYTAAPYFPNFNRLIQWFQPYSEPVRQKRGIQAWLQQFFTAGTKPLATQVTVVLNATETNNDIALFGAVVYNKAVSANVSIRDIPASDSAAVSIEEIPAINGAAASIEET